MLGIDLNQALKLLDTDNQKQSSLEKVAKPVPIKKVTKPKTESSNCKLAGKVIRITDGDTVHVLEESKRRHKIRLAGIDAPEKGQPYNKAATKYLKSMVAGKNVCVDWHKKDRYQRLVGVLNYKGQDINYQMVAKGYAWHFKKYQREQKPEDRILYAAAQKNSRLGVIGLWQEPNPISPDEWRAGKRPAKKASQKSKPKKVKSQVKAVAQSQNTNFSCSGKRFCTHMSSCAEACYYLNQCGLSRLDRDKDGIPCESFCGGC